MPQTGLIFDFDGVIVLSEPVHQRAWVDVAAEFGADLPEGFLERGIGSSDELLARELAAYWDFKDSPLILLDAKRRCYQARCLAETEYVPGIHRALEVLARDYPLAVATSSSEGDIAPHLT
ncbi:HAD family phosphatase, partial [Candidatus Sumerlaeota bacterium]|nr:HAD family phosphatase [Candidatus Sumerlaeota bacterium]